MGKKDKEASIFDEGARYELTDDPPVEQEAEFVKCERCKRRRRDDEAFVDVTDENGDLRVVCEQCAENYPE